jgi:hypothetical protein
MELPLLYPSDKPNCPVLDELHLDSGVCESVSHQHLGQSSLDKLRRCSDAEHSALPAGERSRTLSQRFSVDQKLSGLDQEFVTISCEDDPASDPIE